MLGKAAGLFRIRQAIEERSELVSSHARQQRLTAQAVLELLGNPTQYPVPGLVAKRVIDPLETIQIHVHQGLGLVRTFVAQQHAFSCLIEPTAVEQAGERVGDRLVFELLVQIAHYRHVEHRHHHSLLIGRQRRAGQCHRDQVTACGAQVGVVYSEDLP